MMKSVIAIAAVAGLAAVGSAQDVKFNFSADQSQINVGETVNWTVEATMTGLSDSGYFGGFVGSFVSSDASLGTAGDFVNNLPGQGVPPTPNGASVDTVNVFQSALIYDVVGTSTSFVFFEFSVTAVAEGELSYNALGIATLFGTDNPFAPPIEFTAFPVNSDLVTIVPAPGAIALMGLGGLAATRRRR